MSKAFKWSIAILTVIATVEYLVFFCNLALFKERKTYTCGQCISQQEVWQWRLGGWPDASVPVSSMWTVSHPSWAFRQHFTSSHKHSWIFAQGSPYPAIGGHEGCALGYGWPPNRFACFFEADSELRDRMDGLIKGGVLMEDELKRLLETDFQSAHQGFVDEAAQEKALKLLENHGLSR
ncbi:MAG: hypothetical protein K1X78_09015 [Verrucomicrobiaceae bacterium]|nr:hypothetical protein [Verrucomicrobiaceae bacterium]